MRVEDFNYNLPEELIAQTPLKDRTSSRLLVLDKKTGEIEHLKFANIIDFLDEGDALVLNDTMTNKLLENRRLRKKLRKMIDNMNEIVLYGEEMKENPHEYIKEKLDFPDYYGENLDALYDCLCELPEKIIIIKDSAILEKIIQL